jgi:transcriptional pleiotropic regulator of transition state genes
MKATGIVRKLDPLGRVVLPIELRRTMDINTDDPLEIFVDEDMIILKKYEPSCIFCNEAKNVSMYKDKLICSDCLDDLRGKTI